MIRKVVIPAAGRGTRLLPATKETPKEMLPIFSADLDGEMCVKPLLQSIFEQLYEVNVREFCFIVGKGKESIINHFTSDGAILESLNSKGNREKSRELGEFYRKLVDVSINFLSQPEPRGFGDAVRRAEPFVNESFMVHAGDSLILSKENRHLSRMNDVHERHGCDATFLVQEVMDPRPFGVIEGTEIEKGVYSVNNVLEKPEKPPTNLAITALYVFTPAIFTALKSVPEGVGGELQLTDGIQKLIEDGSKVSAVKLEYDEYWLDIGQPQSYWEALERSYALARETKGKG
jgi:UTP--glucose-1-phosphate uridylyltransferase